MIIPNITPLPPSPQRTDPSTFAARADASLTAQETVFTPELNAFASAVNVTQGEMTVLSDTATTQAQIATTQAAAAASSALSAGATVWVSGTTYTVGVSRYSPLDGQVYRRMVGGAGTTDPSLDAVNWRVVNGLTSELIVLPFNNLPSMRPSLNLDFANNQSVDPRITFTRASTATRTNSKGLIELVPSGVPRIDFDPITGACKGLLIEEQRTNLLQYSQDFDNTGWAKTSIAVTPNSIVAPDGSMTADKLIEGAATSNHYIEQATTNGNATYVASVYVKAAERGLVFVGMSDGATALIGAWFNLASQAMTLSVGGSWTATSSTIEHVGGGWYRCTVASTRGAGTVTLARVYTATSTSSVSYTGDGTSGLFIWGAQLEAGAFPTSYQPSTETFTGRASTATFFGSNGLIQTASSGVARMNYNPANLTVQPKLLLEAAGTNLLTYSEAFDNAGWAFAANVTVTANDTTAPDGTVTADRLAKSANAFAVRGQSATGAAGVYTGSVYVKNGDLGKVTIDLFDGTPSSLVRGVYDFASNSFTALIGSAAALSATVCPNGWVRISATATIAVANPQLRIYPGNATEATAGYVYAWGAQLEAGAFPTSYIPTVASQVTRVADTSTSAQTTRAADVASMTGANFSSWFNASEGTFVVSVFSAQNSAASSPRAFLSATSATSAEQLNLTCGSGDPTARRFDVISSSVVSAQLSFTSSSANETEKFAAAYASNNFGGSKNGLAPVTDNAGVNPSGIDRLGIGNFIGAQAANAYIKHISYYNRRLTNAELQALSTQ